MRIYISTPVNGRHEATFAEKRKAAYRRCVMLRAYLYEEYPDASVFTPFDAVPLDCTIEEPEAIGKCVALLLTCDTVVIDRGWTASKGCNLEYLAAKIYNLNVIDGNGNL